MRKLFFLLCSFVLIPVYAQDQKETIPNPLRDAQVGEWAHYSQQSGTEVIYKVIDKKDMNVVILTQVYYRGKLMNQERTTVNINAPQLEENRQKYAISQESVTVKDTVLPCNVFEADKVKIWTSENIPVYGQVKITVNGTPTMELVDWGIDTQKPVEEDNSASSVQKTQ